MSEEILTEALDSAFVSPERKFKGEALAPYTEGSRILLTQVRDENDSGTFFVWAFLYIHILLKKNKKDAISLAWDKIKFRETLLDWVSKMTKADGALGERLVLSIINESNEGAVEAIPLNHQMAEPEGNA